jgi:hypothetical protein
MVKSFHPMYLEYMREAPNDSVTKAMLREYLFTVVLEIALTTYTEKLIPGPTAKALAQIIC